MNKKMIISNTLLFIGILAFILLFSAVFSQENMLIGISTITAMLMLLERDLTAEPLMNTGKLLTFNLFMGIAAYLANLNMWLGIPVNFIAMFVISYMLIFNLKNPLYLPFSLQYLFLLAMPVGLSGLPLRLGALAFGAIAIMGLQLIFNRNRVAKGGKNLIKAICEALTEKVELIQKGESGAEESARVKSSISSLRSMIYDKREEDYYLTDEGMTLLNISAALEKINLFLNQIQLDKTDERLLNDLQTTLKLAAKGVASDEPLDELKRSFSNLLGKYEGNDNIPLFSLRILANVDSLLDSLYELKKLDRKQGKITRKLHEVPLKFKKLTYGNAPKHTTSIKFSYAIRVAIGITIGAFLTDYFKLEEGRWMLFTILSVSIPIYEQSRQKMRDRLFATIVGALVAVFLFTIFDSNPARSALLLLGGYLMSYIKVYRYSTILVTFSAIGSVVLITGETHFLTTERVLLVASGLVLALMINRFILPYKQTDAISNLQKMYKDTINTMLQELRLGNGDVDNKDNHSMKNLLIITTMIEDRLKVDLEKGSEPANTEWMNQLRLITCSIFELSLWLEKRGLESMRNPDIERSIREMKKVNLQNGVVSSHGIETVVNQIEAASTLENRIALSMIFEITAELAALNKINWKVS
ncbi:FUSC family protein [Aciduricibacillus chroicocephali]|uniref:FUSC family protein n=1 Tax=Aciduricibacillus chroicocephali TaxID=3054939 RepID=A0ABY9KWQ6_9BACI|nr:FUSC family protein [Bacillaceae bacterium 44XB]